MQENKRHVTLVCIFKVYTAVIEIKRYTAESGNDIHLQKCQLKYDEALRMRGFFFMRRLAAIQSPAMQRIILSENQQAGSEGAAPLQQPLYSHCI